MCLILTAYRQHKNYPLVLAANRDEFYDRPTRQIEAWQDRPGIIAGRDLKGSGTWMGIDRQGRLAAITNFRDPANLKPDAPTRGLLVSNFLSGTQSAEPYLKTLSKTADRYNGFNLLLYDRTGLWHFSNRQEAIMALEPGIHGLSNHLLNTPWPKVRRGCKAFAEALEADPTIDPETLLSLMEDRHIAPDDQLPHTGVTLEWERMLSPMFIQSDTYGTRCTSVVTCDSSGMISFVEKTHPHPGSGLDESDTRTFLWAAEGDWRDN
jgi:uncharacterized protein with NRDE domain